MLHAPAAHMKLIYKFLTIAAAKSVLESRHLKVSCLYELNDIFDCCPIIKAPPNPPDMTDDAWSKHVISQSNKNLGVVCFSKTYKSPLMWAHYADDAMGLALGFDFSSEIARKAGWTPPCEVMYRRSRPILHWPADVRDPNFDRELNRKHFHIKAKEWEYEKEVRFVLLLKSCKQKGDHLLAPFPAQMLKQVIFGHRCPVDTEVFQQRLQKDFPVQQIDIQRAHPHPKRFECRISPPLDT